MSRIPKDGAIVKLRQRTDDETGEALGSLELEMKAGTTQDQRDMRRLGKTQQLNVSLPQIELTEMTAAG